ncbi:MAG TPA: hypothetical protein VGV37_16660 [Aliidongia sp.]|uniref:hypothetical protein n=1 Tax=Aliidongia sp. TaxID=1914230 RepID=UPI002DDD9822|nr:hypothetical protein [Aliidongia sp.]HEV2676158.1 hypothetical protein [Aliidongia sp.]
MEKRSSSVRAFPLRLPRSLMRDGWWLCADPAMPAGTVLPFAGPPSRGAPVGEAAFPPSGRDGHQ